eukprot:gene7850-biopygen21087
MLDHGPHDRIQRNGRGPDADRTRTWAFVPEGGGMIPPAPALEEEERLLVALVLLLSPPPASQGSRWGRAEVRAAAVAESSADSGTRVCCENHMLWKVHNAAEPRRCFVELCPVVSRCGMPMFSSNTRQPRKH